MQHQHSCQKSIQTDFCRPANNLKMWASIPKTASHQEINEAIQRYHIQDLSMYFNYMQVSTQQDSIDPTIGEDDRIRVRLFENEPDYLKLWYSKYFGPRNYSIKCYAYGIATIAALCLNSSFWCFVMAIVKGNWYWWPLCCCSGITPSCIFHHKYQYCRRRYLGK